MNAEQNRSGKAPSGARSMLGASVFWVTAVTLTVMPILLRAQRGTSERERTKATSSRPHHFVATAHPAWKTCENGELGFEFEYPADWKIIYHLASQGAAERPPIFADSCEMPRNPGGYFGLTLARGVTSSSSLYIEVCDRDCMKQSIYGRAQTLKQYLAMKPFEVQNNPVTGTSRIGGETAVVLEDGSILAMRDGLKYFLHISQTTPTRTRVHLLKTFSFIEPTR